MNMKDVKEITIPQGILADTQKTFSPATNTNGSLTYFDDYGTSSVSLGLNSSLRIKGKCTFSSGTYAWTGIWYFDKEGNQVQIVPEGGTTTEFDITCYLNQDGWVSNKWNVFVLGGQLGSNYRRIRVVVSKNGSNTLDIYTQSDTATGIVSLEIDEVELRVSKIEDGNGNIIWGSYSAFPYRKLEYIHFAGVDEYINTGLNSHAGKYREVTVSLDDASTPSSDIYILGSRDTSATASQQRYWLPRLDGNGIRFVIGNTWTANNAYPIANYITANTKRTFLASVTGSSNLTMYFGLKDENGDSLISGNISGGTSSGFETRTLALMATNDGSGSSGMTPKGFCAGKVYSLIEKQTSSSGTVLHSFIPCQRKSDGVCGLYDTVAKSFKAMEGTTTGATAAGPVINEYWDLTA